MSGFPDGSGDSNGLDSLFAQLRQQQNNKPINLEPSTSYGYYNNGYYSQPSQPQQLPIGYHQPSVSSPLPQPPTPGQQPHHSSAIMSPADTPQPRIPPASGGASNADRTSSLLNLLKFSQPSASSSKQPAPIGTPLPPSRETSMGFPASEILGQASSSGHGRGDSDLLATLMGSIKPKPAQRPSPKFSPAPQGAPFSSSAEETIPSVDSQNYLLQLLNQPKPSQSDASPQLKETKILTPPSKASSRDDVSELAQVLEDSSLNMNLMGSETTEGRLESSLGKENVRESTPKHTQGLFTYVNPFEQLAASSPRVRTPKNTTPGASSSVTPAIQILKRQGESTDNKRKMDERSTISSPAHTKRKLGSTSQVSSGPPTPLPDGRTQLEALIGIGASGSKETVTDALHEVGGQVDKQVQEAIARAEQEESQSIIEKDLEDMLASKTVEEFEETAQIAAMAIKKELEKEDNTSALDSLPTPLADVVKDIIDEAAQGHIADSWESADAEDGPIKEGEEGVVKVYNFPMRPWTSITIKESDEPRPTFRDDIVTDIARLKKDFDQIDRTLVTASNNFIVYAMSKNGGIRIIRQDDGKDTKLFSVTHDRIFSVVTSVSAPDLKETIIGTGISGTVYWAVVKDGLGDYIEDSHPEMHGFALPPIQSQDNESPGGILKTRARKSSAHPDFFAVGRGKSIHIIWPSVIMKSYLKNGNDRIVDTEKYLNQHSLKVNTGKAGKDFTFSEDDTTIVSLDKAGRVKFWDVRPLTVPPSHAQSIEIKEPLVTFITTPATEKSWPTSVLFVDKLRPYQRGGALRYLIVGMKQNHTLQLWDLALGKPVQEIHLPHGKESDAVCSVMYHAATGMIIVGHPTRNSIYFLHLSAPKYNLPKAITQAEYMQKLVANDPSIPKPDSTAVISGMREYSFANKGSLRSLDILQTPNSSASVGDPTTMFELYAMHSKGVTCLGIKQADLGWTEDNKVIQPVVADKAGVISIDTLKEIPVTPTPDVSDSASAPQSTLPTRIVSRPTPKETIPKETSKKASHVDAVASSSKAEDKPERKESHHNGGFASASGTEKAEKKKRRKANSSSETPAPSAPSHAHPPKAIILDPSSNVRNGNASKPVINTIPESGDVGFQDSGIEARVAEEVKKLFGESLDSLYQNLKDDRRTQAAVAEAKQDAMLRLVSSTLSDNIEATLGRIVGASIQKSVLPAISEVALKAVNEQVGSKVNSSLSNSLPKELQKVLPDAIGKALQQPQLLKLMSESLAKSVAFRVEDQFAAILQSTITPAFTQLAVNASLRVASDVQRQAEEQIGTLERQSHADSLKIDQLMQLVTGLSETVSTMASAQTEFQGQFLRMQQQLSEKRESSHQSHSGAGTSTALAAPAEKSPQQLEYETLVEGVIKDLNGSDFQEAILRWLRSGLHQEVFEGLLCKYSPNFIRDLPPIYLIAVGSVVSERLESPSMAQRLAWLETIIQTLQARVAKGEVDDEELRAQLVKIVGTYVNRLEHLFMVHTSRLPGDPFLKRISMITVTANQVIRAAERLVPSQDMPPLSLMGNTGHHTTGHHL